MEIKWKTKFYTTTIIVESNASKTSKLPGARTEPDYIHINKCNYYFNNNNKCIHYNAVRRIIILCEPVCSFIYIYLSILMYIHVYIYVCIYYIFHLTMTVIPNFIQTKNVLWISKFGSRSIATILFAGRPPNANEYKYRTGSKSIRCPA